MLQKKNRLTTAAFDEHFKAGKRRHSPNLQLIHVHNSAFHGAVVVGKKVYKEAVKRNRLRRQIYNLVYRAFKAGQITGVVIIIAKPSAKQTPRKTLLAEARELIATVRSL